MENIASALGWVSSAHPPYTAAEMQVIADMYDVPLAALQPPAPAPAPTGRALPPNALAWAK